MLLKTFPAPGGAGFPVRAEEKLGLNPAGRHRRIQSQRRRDRTVEKIFVSDGRSGKATSVVSSRCISSSDSASSGRLNGSGASAGSPSSCDSDGMR